MQRHIERLEVRAVAALRAQGRLKSRCPLIALLGSPAMSGFAPLLEDKRASNLAKPGVTVFEYTP